MKPRLPLYVVAVLTSLLLAVTLACSQIHTSTAAAAGTADDPAITSAIQGKLYADPVIQTKQITVQTADGVVTLAGIVSTEAERTAAAAQAASVRGVRTVINNITVTPEQTAAARPVPYVKHRAGTPVTCETEIPFPH